MHDEVAQVQGGQGLEDGALGPKRKPSFDRRWGRQKLVDGAVGAEVEEQPPGSGRVLGVGGAGEQPGEGRGEKGAAEAVQQLASGEMHR
jgi:hypothetical protein